MAESCMIQDLSRVIFSHKASAYGTPPREAEMNKKLKFTWVASNDDTSRFFS